jgi:hypothetical protein
MFVKFGNQLYQGPHSQKQILPVLAEQDYDHMDQEFTKEEIKKAISSALVARAPGLSERSIAIYKYIFTGPNIFARALNELAFGSGLIKSPSFAWLRERRIVSTQRDMLYTSTAPFPMRYTTTGHTSMRCTFTTQFTQAPKKFF